MDNESLVEHYDKSNHGVFLFTELTLYIERKMQFTSFVDLYFGADNLIFKIYSRSKNGNRMKYSISFSTRVFFVPNEIHAHAFFRTLDSHIAKANESFKSNYLK